MDKFFIKKTCASHMFKEHVNIILQAQFEGKFCPYKINVLAFNGFDPLN
jgi:hypothetical protein